MSLSGKNDLAGDKQNSPGATTHQQCVENAACKDKLFFKFTTLQCVRRVLPREFGRVRASYNHTAQLQSFKAPTTASVASAASVTSAALKTAGKCISYLISY